MSKHPTGPTGIEPDGAGDLESAAGASPLGRRSFLKLMGLSSAAFALACRRGPEEQVVPLAEAAPGAPGSAVWYATTCGACAAGCGLLVKTRDGRPIKVEGNPEHPVSRGGVCAVGQASVLSLYDASRLRAPVLFGLRAEWPRLDAHVRETLERLAKQGRPIFVLLPASIGPAERLAVERFAARYPTCRVARHDPVGTRAAMVAAGRATRGRSRIPWPRFDRARVVASFGADFLGTWLSPVAFARQRAESGAGRARHWQLEGPVSLTGTCADRRVALLPSQTVAALAGLCARLFDRAGLEPPPTLAAAGRPDPAIEPELDTLAGELWEARGASLVVCGGEDPAAQALADQANELLGSHGTTLEPGATEDREDELPLEAFLAELWAGRIGGAIFLGTNPVYGHPLGAKVAGLVEGLELAVSTSPRIDETGYSARIVAPDHHFLESWGDAAPAPGVLGLRQPTVKPLWRTRSAAESLLRWAGDETSHRELVATRWEREVYPRTHEAVEGAERFWQRSLHDGYALVPRAAEEAPFAPEGLARLLGKRPAVGRGGLELAVYESVGQRDGRHVDNAWLQELPAPVTSGSWGNHACLAPATAAALGVGDGDLVRLAVGRSGIHLPVRVVPGTHPAMVAVAMGYGHRFAGPVGKGVGMNPGYFTVGCAPHRFRVSVEPRRLGRRVPAVRAPRLALESATVAAAGTVAGGGRRWGLVIDLDACTGCGACVVSCQAENNLPAVGPEEAARGRTMHWVRLEHHLDADGRATHRPMLCLHCGNAPCESACPVLAAVGTREGVSQQVYARCVGTRYCAAACPVKARRFNWSDHPRDPVERLVLNPDLVVRGRGVMEKCSLCGHRIEEAKARARIEGRALRPDEVRTACQQSCPSGAIHFGDLGDPESGISRVAGAAQVLLPQLGLDPSVRYLPRGRDRRRGG